MKGQNPTQIKTLTHHKNNTNQGFCFTNSCRRVHRTPDKTPRRCSCSSLTWTHEGRWACSHIKHRFHSCPGRWHWWRFQRHERLSHLDTLQTLYSSRFLFHFFSFYANRTTSQFETFWNRRSIWVVSLFFRPLPAQKRKRPTRLWQAGHKAVHLFRLSLICFLTPPTIEIVGFPGLRLVKQSSNNLNNSAIPAVIIWFLFGIIGLGFYQRSLQQGQRLGNFGFKVRYVGFHISPIRLTGLVLGKQNDILE